MIHWSLVLTLLATGCETTIYYPAPLDPLPGWQSACADVVDATVVVENTGADPVEVHELLPDDGCAPDHRGTVAPGETAALGVAVGAVWRAYNADTHAWLGTFELENGENILVVP